MKHLHWLLWHLRSLWHKLLHWLSHWLCHWLCNWLWHCLLHGLLHGLLHDLWHDLWHGHLGLSLLHHLLRLLEHLLSHRLHLGLLHGHYHLRSLLRCHLHLRNCLHHLHPVVHHLLCQRCSWNHARLSWHLLHWVHVKLRHSLHGWHRLTCCHRWHRRHLRHRLCRWHCWHSWHSRRHRLQSWHCLNLWHSLYLWHLLLCCCHHLLHWHCCLCSSCCHALLYLLRWSSLLYLLNLLFSDWHYLLTLINDWSLFLMKFLRSLVSKLLHRTDFLRNRLLYNCWLHSLLHILHLLERLMSDHLSFMLVHLILGHVCEMVHFHHLLVTRLL